MTPVEAMNEALELEHWKSAGEWYDMARALWDEADSLRNIWDNDHTARFVELLAAEAMRTAMRHACDEMRCRGLMTRDEVQQMRTDWHEHFRRLQRALIRGEEVAA